MKINIAELKFTIRKATEEKKHPNLLAHVTLAFKGESGEYFTVSGFTLWKSNFGGYNLAVPSKPGFKYFLMEKSLWQKIKKEVIRQYEDQDIPIVEEN